MKTLYVLAILLLFSLTGMSGVDTSAYYASSRLNYYTNEELGEVLVFTPERLKSVRIKIDLVFEQEFLNRGFDIISGGVFTVPFELKRLRVGDNEVTVSFYENDKWVDSRKIWITLRDHHESNVRIDRATGGLVADGMPLLPFGFYTCAPVEENNLDLEAISGFNMISPYQKIDKKTKKTRVAYMNRCADLGVRVNYNLSNVSGSGRDQELLRREIELMRGHPALLAWYIAEEPDNAGLPPDTLKKAYDLIRELDPYHPVTILVSSPRMTDEYGQVADIIMTKPLPVPQGALNEVVDYTSRNMQKFHFEKPVWLVGQAFGGQAWQEREPNAREVRAMTYLAIVHGATGVQYYKREGLNTYPKSTAMWAECGALALEFAELAPYILSPHPAPGVVTDTPGLHARAWNRAGVVIIAVVNENNEPSAFRLQMKDIDLSISADVLFENRKIAVQEGYLTDIIDGYGTRVYRFDARDKIARTHEPESGNLTLDPGFEDISSAGVPSFCAAHAGTDGGSTYFTDSRRHFEGEHSLRMNNPSVEPGTSLKFYAITVYPGRSYTLSVMARTGSSSNSRQVRKAGPLSFRLALGSQAKEFTLSDKWERYEIKGVRFDMSGEDNLRVSPELQILGKGTIWFDLLQVLAE